jgi:hypothetical protein
MSLKPNHLCWVLKMPYTSFVRLLAELEYQPAWRGRGGPGHGMFFSAKDALTLTEIGVMRQHGFPIGLLQHAIRVSYADMSEELCLALILDEPLPYPEGEELIAKWERGEVKNTLFTPQVLRACNRAVKRLAKVVKTQLRKADGVA